MLDEDIESLLLTNIWIVNQKLFLIIKGMDFLTANGLVLNQIIN